MEDPCDDETSIIANRLEGRSVTTEPPKATFRLRGGFPIKTLREAHVVIDLSKTADQLVLSRSLHNHAESISGPVA